MDDQLLPSMIAGAATIVAAMLAPLVQWALRAIPRKRDPASADRRARLGFFCFITLLAVGIFVSAYFYFSATGKCATITPAFGRSLCGWMITNASMNLRHGSSETLPQTLEWISPTVSEISSATYYVKDMDLLTKSPRAVAPPVRLAPRCIFWESHLRPVCSWTGFMLTKPFFEQSVDLSSATNLILVIKADHKDFLEFGIRDTTGNESKVKVPVHAGWRGYVIPMTSFRRVDTERLSVLVLAHSVSVSSEANNRFWVSLLEFQ